MDLNLIKKFCISLCLTASIGTLNASQVNNNASINEAFLDDFSNEFASLEKEKEFDPLEKYNRFMTNINDKIYVYALEPVSNGYKKATPDFFRESLSNVINNLLFPVRFINNLLQLKFENSAIELSRFFVNTTIGIGGIFDVANSEFNLKEKNEDFGQTLGHYGVGEGFHIVIPVLGPSNLRDVVGLGADYSVNPLTTTVDDKLKYKIPNNTEEEFIYTGVTSLNSLPERMEQYNAVKAGTVDLYPVLKEFYNKKREKEINE